MILDRRLIYFDTCDQIWTCKIQIAILVGKKISLLILNYSMNLSNFLTYHFGRYYSADVLVPDYIFLEQDLIVVNFDLVVSWKCIMKYKTKMCNWILCWFYSRSCSYIFAHIYSGVWKKLNVSEIRPFSRRPCKCTNWVFFWNFIYLNYRFKNKSQSCEYKSYRG